MATITRAQVESAVAALGTRKLVNAMAECYVAYSAGRAVSDALLEHLCKHQDLQLHENTPSACMHRARVPRSIITII